MEVELLGQDDWETLRDVRLKALKDSPGAFLSRYDDEVHYTDGQWQRLAVDGLYVVARSGHQAVGLARSVHTRDLGRRQRYIESVWVDPTHRGIGVLRALVECLRQIEPTVREWLVWVLDGNDTAVTAYRQLEFVDQDEVQVPPGRPDRQERRLRLRVP